MKLSWPLPKRRQVRDHNSKAGAANPTTKLTEVALRDLSGWRLQRVMLVFGLLVLVAVIVVSLHVGEIGAFAQQIARTRPLWIGAAIAAQFFAFLFLALAWGLALSSLGARRPLRDLYPLTLGMLFADQAVPSAGISGAFFIFHALTRRGASRDVALTVFVLGSASFIAAFALCVIASLAILAMRQEVAVMGVIEAVGVVVLVFAMLAATLAVSVLRFSFIREWISRIPFLNRLSEFFGRAAESIRRDRRLFARCVTRQVLARGFDVVTLWLCFLAVAAHVDLVVAFVAVSIASLGATLAPTPMGVGSFEGSMVAILSALGVPVETALTTTLLYRGLSLWGPLALGFFVVQRELLAPKSSAPQTIVD